jgi:hypothetical protein
VLTIGDASFFEPDTGTEDVSVTITVSEQSSSAITVDFTTADGTAVAGVDYFGASGALTIPALTTSYDLILELIGDTLDEPDEDFSVTLSNPVGAVLGMPAIGTLTILDNDPMAELTAADVMVGEGSGVADISVVLNQPSGFDVAVDYTTADGTAAAPGDYGTVNGVATIPRGSTTTVIPVPIVDDGEIEPDEFFNVEFSLPTNVVLLTPSATVTIIDNDGCDIPGDANGDCLLDAADLALIIIVVDDPAVLTPGDPDCTGDGFVDGSDLVCVAQAVVTR